MKLVHRTYTWGAGLWKTLGPAGTMVGACLLVSFGFGLIILAQEFDRYHASTETTLRGLIGRWVKTASADYLSRQTLVDRAAAWANAPPATREEARSGLRRALDQLGQEFERQARTTPGLDIVALELTSGPTSLASWSSRQADPGDSQRLDGVPVLAPGPGAPGVTLAVGYRVAPEIEDGLTGLQSAYRKLLMALLGLSGYSLICFGYMVQHARALRERAAREAARDATLDLADRTCHELGNVVFALGNERRNLSDHLDLLGRFLAEEGEARAEAARRAGLDPTQAARFEKAVVRAYEERGIDPGVELLASATIARDVCRQVEVCAQYIALTVRELDSYLKQSALPASPRAISLSSCLDDALALLGPRLGAAGAHVARPDTDPTLLADRRLLVHALINVLKNALEAASGAGRAPELQVRTEAGGGEVHIDVADNGPGIAPEVRTHLFEPDQTTKGPGRGRGLAIARESIEVQGGRVEVLSTGPDGTTLRITLPAAGDDPGTEDR